MKMSKHLIKTIKGMDFPEYVLEQLSANPSLIMAGFTRTCKPPHKERKASSYDIHTKYGLLYVMFNNAKKKYELPNYDVRQEFIDHHIKDKTFKKLWKKYEKNDYELSYKPTLYVENSAVEFPLLPNNTQMMNYSDYMKKRNLSVSRSVTEYKTNAQGNFKPLRIFDSIKQAAEKTGVSNVTIRAHLKKFKAGLNTAVFRDTTEEHREYIKEKKKNMKQDTMQPMKKV